MEPLCAKLQLWKDGEIEHDDRVIVLGEDVGVNGGVFRATAGLQQKFGAERV